MKTKNLNNIRNIGIMAHIDAGKTTTTERILFYTGLTHKLGEVHDGTAVMDWMEQEQTRGITITSAAISCFWKDRKINIIDTPGHVDFTVEVERSLRVIDGGILLLDAKNGVEAQTEAVWHQACKYAIPSLIFINKMDMVGANYKNALEEIKNILKIQPLLMTLPIGDEKNFEGLISLISMKAYYYSGKFGEDLQIKDIPESYMEAAFDSRNKMIEILADYNTELMVKYLNEEIISEDFLDKIIRQATLSNEIVPVFLGAAYKNKGVQNLLDGIVKYLPSPSDRPEIKGFDLEEKDKVRQARDDVPFSGLIFKVSTDPFVGKLSYLRVYSGIIRVGDLLLNPRVLKEEKIQKIIEIQANNRKEVDQGSTGDIIAVVGLKHTTTGDTLTDKKDQIIYESIDFPEPVIYRAVEAKTPGDYDKMMDSLYKLEEEDPTLKIRTDSETGQTLISGMGELHLEIILDRLIKEFNVKVNTGQPQVTYKESIRNKVVADYTLTKSAGHQVLYAYVKLRVKPNKRGYGHKLSRASLENVPIQYIKACQDGINHSLKSGVISGYEVIDLDIEILELGYKVDQSSEVAFISAGATALTQALKKGNSELLEPIFKVEVHMPETYIGEVIDDMNKRMGLILESKIGGLGHILKAHVPLSKMFGYATDLRSITHGHGYYSMVFSHYDWI